MYNDTLVPYRTIIQQSKSDMGDGMGFSEVQLLTLPAVQKIIHPRLLHPGSTSEAPSASLHTHTGAW